MGAAGRDNVFVRLHRWATVPKVELERDAHELYAVTSYTCLLGLLSYLSYIPLFVVIGAENIAVVNVGVVICFAVAIYLVRSGRIFHGMATASTLVAIHAWITVLTVGGDAAFQLHVLLALQLGLLFTYVKTSVRVAYGLLFMAAYLGLVAVAEVLPPAMRLDPGWELVLRVSNSAIFVGVTIAIATTYAWTVRSNRDARDKMLRKVEERNAHLLHAREQLGAARDMAEEASKAKSMFLANMSHELRTPLNAIIGYAEMIEEEAQDEGDEELERSVGRIRSSGRHLLSLINDILDLSKIEAGRMRVEAVEFIVQDCLYEIIETSRALAHEKDNELALELGDELGTMRSDPTKIKQILLNLLSNACKFTEGGSVTLTVDAQTVHGREGLRFQVSDTGIGIAPDKLEHVFGEFEQADSSTTRRFGGTGLGLAITYRFCLMLEGSIDVASEEGVGSTFTVWLPRKLLQRSLTTSSVH